MRWNPYNQHKATLYVTPLLLPALLIMFALLLTACGPDANNNSTTTTLGAESTPTTGAGGLMVRGTATVDDLQVILLQSAPVQVQARVKGNLPDSCTKLSDTKQTRNGSVITVTLTTARPANLMCMQVLVPYEQTITVDTGGLTPGTYTLDVNGVQKQFELK